MERCWHCSRGFTASRTDSEMAARSASEAYRWAREVPVSIVITDVELPGDEDGRCLTRKLKGDRRIHEVPVAVLANRIIGSVRKAAGDAGCHLITARASPATVLPLVGPLMSRRRRYGQANQRDGTTNTAAATSHATL